MDQTCFSNRDLDNLEANSTPRRHLLPLLLVQCPVHTIRYLMESNPMDFFVRYPMKLTFISLAYTPSVKNLIVSNAVT